MSDINSWVGVVASYLTVGAFIGAAIRTVWISWRRYWSRIPWKRQLVVAWIISGISLLLFTTGAVAQVVSGHTTWLPYLIFVGTAGAIIGAILIG